SLRTSCRGGTAWAAAPLSAERAASSSSRAPLLQEVHKRARAGAQRPALVVDHMKVSPDLQPLDRDHTQPSRPHLVLDGVSGDERDSQPGKHGALDRLRMV